MSNSQSDATEAKFLKFLQMALDGAISDADELRTHLAVSDREAREVLDRPRASEAGRVRVAPRDMAILAMFGAKGAARQGLEYLQNGDVSLALVAALSAQRAVTCSAGTLLGLQLGETLKAKKRALSKLSTKGADRRHEENRSLKKTSLPGAIRT
jgi:hypothetical protein